jgi:hypothetical protein
MTLLSYISIIGISILSGKNVSFILYPVENMTILYSTL